MTRLFFIHLLFTLLFLPLSAVYLTILSPLDDTTYLEGSQIWTNVKLEVEPNDTMIESSILCVELNGINDECSNISQHAELPNFSNLPNGNHRLCVSLKYEEIDANAGPSLRDMSELLSNNSRSCVTFQKGAEALQRRAHRVLGIKFGQHGDDASISFAVGGVVISKQPLSELWQPLSELEKKLTRHEVLHPGGFCGACDNGEDALWVTRAGSCEACTPFGSLIERWRGIFENFYLTRKLNDIDDICDKENDYSDVRKNQNWPTDAVIIAAAPEDISRERVADAIREALQRHTQRNGHFCRPADPGEEYRGKEQISEGPMWVVADPYVSAVDTAILLVDSPEKSSSYSLHDREIGNTKQPGFSDDVDAARLSSAVISSLIRRSKSSSEGDGAPFSVCRPGWGWELTLSHRYRRFIGGRMGDRSNQNDYALPSASEMALLHLHAGIYGRLGDHSAGSLRGYFEIWNDAMAKCKLAGDRSYFFSVLSIIVWL